MGDTALVLGGGGLTGIGWEIGVLHGLARAGVDLTTAGLVVGTSAGSVVGAQLTSGLLTPEELYERQLVPPDGETAAHMGAMIMARFAWGVVRSRDAKSYGMRMGRMALAARTPREAERRAVIAQRLVSHEWPARRLVVTAVDAVTGEFRAFGAGDGVPLVDAVSASCAVPGVWPPVTIGGRRWIDGGVRSAANADLASGYARVVVLAPVTVGGGPVPAARAQAARLAAEGSRVVLITPDRAARDAFGRNVLDPERRAPAARAGLAQAAAHAEDVARVWS
ncbi:patatin-like phospholipase family protein [Streptomyces sp. GC420]|uniref:patatin-like phospholipase family protein n=1 Tax=Streptomyces sp. GC420 TaxID=2697568 RepID=UPI001414F998|nr:patatin-like phospholipase family protein [Streptomyces sp. GC420]NBM18592.1 patatin-like phospholipase family protein [Streptomyces sp. GC420]